MESVTLTKGAWNAILLSSKNTYASCNDSSCDIRLLLGILQDSDGAVIVFRAANIDPLMIRSEAQKLLNANLYGSNSDGIKSILAAAVEKSRQCKHAGIGTEHLLFGMLADDSSVLNRIFSNLGIERHPVMRALESRLLHLVIYDPSNGKKLSKMAWRRKMTMLLPYTAGGRIATGIFSIFVLLVGLSGCWLAIFARRDAMARHKFGIGDAIGASLLFELSLLLALTAAASFIWAIAAPKWMEKCLESLAAKTMFWMKTLVIMGIMFIVGCVFLVLLAMLNH